MAKCKNPGFAFSFIEFEISVVLTVSSKIAKIGNNIELGHSAIVLQF